MCSTTARQEVKLTHSNGCHAQDQRRRPGHHHRRTSTVEITAVAVNVHAGAAIFDGDDQVHDAHRQRRRLAIVHAGRGEHLVTPSPRPEPHARETHDWLIVAPWWQWTRRRADIRAGRRIRAGDPEVFQRPIRVDEFLRRSAAAGPSGTTTISVHVATKLSCRSLSVRRAGKPRRLSDFSATCPTRGAIAQDLSRHAQAVLSRRLPGALRRAGVSEGRPARSWARSASSCAGAPPPCRPGGAGAGAAAPPGDQCRTRCGWTCSTGERGARARPRLATRGSIGRMLVHGSRVPRAA